MVAVLRMEEVRMATSLRMEEGRDGLAEFVILKGYFHSSLEMMPDSY